MIRACWCGATTAQVVGHFDASVVPRERMPADGDLVRCEGCGVLALEPQPSDADLAAAYASDYYGASRKKFSGPIARAISLFQGGRARLVCRRVPPGSRVLDVGCGNGGFLMGLKRRGYIVEGTEWSEESAQRVPASAGIPVHVGDLLKVDLPPQSYDAITMWHVLEHVRRPDETVAKIRSLLKPNGWFFLAVPNAGSTQAERYGVHWFHHDPPRHLFGFTLDSLTSLLGRTGFRTVSNTTFSFEQNPFGEIQSALNARGSARRDRLYDRLKGVEPRGAEALADLARLGTLLLPALARSTFESIRRNGASLQLEAQLAP